MLNADELRRTTALIYVDNRQYYTVSWRTPDKEVRPSSYTVVPNSCKHYHLTHVNRWSDYVGYRIETAKNLAG